MSENHKGTPLGADETAQSAKAISGKIKRLSPRRIVQRIYDSNDPVVTTQRLAPYSLYSLLLRLGFDEGAEVLAMANREQIARSFDLHCWNGESFDESKFLELLASTDATESLDLLHRMVASMDPKLLALMISRHVTTEVFEEPTDQPPGDGYYTPDRGFTWVKVSDDNESLYFQMNRLLALVFDKQPAVFYQLIALPQVHTSSMLEDEAYREKVKSLEGLGFPSTQRCAELTAPLTPTLLKAEFGIELAAQAATPKTAGTANQTSKGIQTDVQYSRLQSLRAEITHEDVFNGEIQLLINAATLQWQIPFSDMEKLRLTTERVLATLELGLETVGSTADCRGIYEKTQLAVFFRLGLWQLRELNKIAWKIRHAINLEDLNSHLSQLLEATCNPLPGVPVWWSEDWKAEESANKAATDKPTPYRSILTLHELAVLKQQLPGLFPVNLP